MDGHAPSPESLGNLLERNIEVTLVSYEIDILNWLELCAKEAFRTPHLRETIIQYITLIKKLTGQTLSTEHKMEIIDLLLLENNLESALSIERTLKKAKIEVQKLVWRDLVEEFKSKGYSVNFVNNEFTKVEDNICDSFYDAGKKRSKDYGIEIKVAEVDDYTIHMFVWIDYNIYYGFTAALKGSRGKFANDPKLLPLNATIAKLSTNWTKDSGTGWIFAWRYPEKKINFMTFDGDTAKLANPDDRKLWIKDTSTEIVELIREFESSKSQTSLATALYPNAR